MTRTLNYHISAISFHNFPFSLTRTLNYHISAISFHNFPFSVTCIVMEKKMKQGQQHFHALVVDDSPVNRKLMEKLLTLCSYHVTCVESVDQALQYLGLHHDTTATTSTSSERLKVDLIITDYSMPGMTGYDLLKRVKGSIRKDVPVVVMSSDDVASMCMEGGAEDFLWKPVQLSDLKKFDPHLLKSRGSSTSTSI